MHAAAWLIDPANVVAATETDENNSEPIARHWFVTWLQFMDDIFWSVL